MQRLRYAQARPSALMAIGLLFMMLMSSFLVHAQQLGGMPITNNLILTKFAPLDVDMQGLLSAIDDVAVPDFALALQYYRGEKSTLTEWDGSKLSLQSLSRESEDGETYAELYKAYFRSSTFADDFVMSALQKTGVFAQASDIVRVESAYHGIINLGLFLNLQHDLDEVEDFCKSTTAPIASDVRTEFEEAWSKYAGSLVSTNGGVMYYDLANYMCASFGTCLADNTAVLNTRVYAMFKQGIQAASSVPVNCPGITQSTQTISRLLLVPLIQGLLKYAYRADPLSPFNDEPKEKGLAEGWAFATALLPVINRCSPSIAAIVRDNLDLAKAYGSGKSAMSIGYVKFSEHIASLYSCLDISCSDVGTLVTAGATAPRQCLDDGLLSSSLQSIAGITVSGDIMTKFAPLDLDQYRLIQALKGQSENATYQPDYALAKKHYAGEFSTLTEWDGTKLSLKAMAMEDMTGEPFFDLYKAYWGGSNTFLNDFVMDPLNGVNSYLGASTLLRVEAAYHSVINHVLFMNLQHDLNEVEEACSGITPPENPIALVTEFQEFWSKYAGSFQLSENQEGFMFYGTANDFCPLFGTCLPSGQAVLNARMYALVQQGIADAQALRCAGILQVKNAISKLLIVPLLQGLLKYSYRTDPVTPWNDEPKEEVLGEAWTFGASILPLLNRCNPTVAELVKANLDIGIVGPGKLPHMKNGYVKLIQQVQSTFSCLGVSCTDVGTLSQGPTCTDKDSLPSKTQLGGLTVKPLIATKFAPLDVDFLCLLQALQAGATPNWSKAIGCYKGDFSSLSDFGGEKVSLQYLSSPATGETLYEMYAAYYGSKTFSNDFVMAALQGTGSAFTNTPTVVRVEAAYHAVLLSVVWMNVIHDLNEVSTGCSGGETDTDLATEFQEAWAKYTGSFQTDDTFLGVMLYGLNNNLCKDFGTCLPSGQAVVNARLFSLFNQGIVAASVKPQPFCDGVVSARNLIEVESRVPLFQGLIKYIYKADPASGYVGDKNEYLSEAWTYARALLPLINACNPTVAAQLVANLDLSRIGPNKAAAVKDGYLKLTAAVRTVYSCLGVKCADVGSLSYAPNGGQCLDSVPATYGTNGVGAASTTSTLNGGAVAAIVIVVLFVFFASLFFAYKRGKNSSADSTARGLHDNSKWNFDAGRSSAAPNRSNASTNGFGSKAHQDTIQVV